MKKQITFLFTFLLSMLLFSSCDDSILNENPKSFLADENLYTNTAGFEAALSPLYTLVRSERGSDWDIHGMFLGTDLCHLGGAPNSNSAPFASYGGSITSEITAVSHHWDRAYRGISWANKIIEEAEKPEIIWNNSGDKARVTAEAKFFRAYNHWRLATLYGDVPLVDEFISAPKLDFVRTTQQEVLEFVRDDLIYASENLPSDYNRPSGKLTRWAALHLLSTVYLQLDNPAQAEIAADEIISSGTFSLMTERFGAKASEPGDVFSDLFLEGNQGRSSGNMESIWIMRQTYPGSAEGGGRDWSRRNFSALYWQVPGLQIADSLGGRSGGQVRPLTNWLESFEPDDMRASKYNIRRQYYYNDPDNLPEGVQLGDPVPKLTAVDSTIRMYPHPRKWEFGAIDRGGSATHLEMDKDRMKYRLAETYLLLAEALHLQGKNDEAADAINEVRSRANASLITAGDVDMDLILDERGRELMQEVPRRLTLYRTGMFLERVRSLNRHVQNDVQDRHALFPIPQSAIDRNIHHQMSQNPGY
jgi:starch-binding outer membrane protein, SusD/RagB family